MAWVISDTGLGSNSAYSFTASPAPGNYSISTTPTNSIITSDAFNGGPSGATTYVVQTKLTTASGTSQLVPLQPAPGALISRAYFALNQPGLESSYKPLTMAEFSYGISTPGNPNYEPGVGGSTGTFARIGLKGTSPTGGDWNAGGMALSGGLSVYRNDTQTINESFTNAGSNVFKVTRTPCPSTVNALQSYNTGSPGVTAYYAAFYHTGVNRGSIYTPGSPGTTTVYATSSDYRLKKDITPLEVSEELDKINQLKPRRWKWTSSNDPSVGFVAHEVQEVYDTASEFVSGKKDEVEIYGAICYLETGEYVNTYEELNDGSEPVIRPVLIKEPSQEEKDKLLAEGKEWKYLPLYDKPVYQQMDPSFLVSSLVASVQALTARVQGLESRVAALESA